MDHLHCNGIRSKFWEPDDSVIASAKACLAPWAGLQPLMPVFSSGQWAGLAPDLYGALGAQYKLTEKVSLNAEYEHLGKTMSNAWSLGVKVGF